MRKMEERFKKSEQQMNGKNENMYPLVRMFAKYVSQNILGMIGISLYILADTFFISRAEGANGITALNLVLPIYSLIFAIGAMIGVGSAIRFKIERARGAQSAELYFSNAISFALVFGAVFMVLGGCFAPAGLACLLSSGSYPPALQRWYSIC